MLLNKNILYRRIFFICFWIWAVFGFVQDEILSVLGGFRAIVFLAVDLTILYLGLKMLKSRAIIVFVFAFVALAFLTTVIVQGLTMINLINGCRDFLPFLMVPIFLYFIGNEKSKYEFVESFDKQLYVFLLIQIPCVLYQFLMYGAGDRVGGSLGNGYSGTLSLIIYICSFYLLQKKWSYNNYLGELWSNKIFFVFIILTFLNETKISFILVICFFLCLIRIDRKFIFRLLLGLPLVLVLSYFALNIYMSVTNDVTNQVLEISYYTDEYLDTNDPEQLLLIAEMLQDGSFEDDNWSVDLPRFTKIAFYPALMDESNNSQLIGAGLSHFKGMSVLEQTEFARNNSTMLTGTIPYLYFILVQLGWIGFIGFVLYIMYILKMFKRIESRALNIQLFLLIVTILVLFYNDAFRLGIFGMIYMYLAVMSVNKIEEKVFVDTE